MWELQGEGEGVAICLPLRPLAITSVHKRGICLCTCLYAWVHASDQAWEGLGKAGLQGILLKLSLPKLLGSLV